MSDAEKDREAVEWLEEELAFATKTEGSGLWLTPEQAKDILALARRALRMEVVPGVALDTRSGRAAIGAGIETWGPRYRPLYAEAPDE